MPAGRERKIGEVTKITTQNGQLVVEIVEDGALLRDPVTYDPIAKVSTRNPYEIQKTVRRVCSFLKHKKTLEGLGVQLAPGSMDMLMGLFNTKGWNRDGAVTAAERDSIEQSLLAKAREGGRTPRKLVIPVLRDRPLSKKS